jgi:TPR repeat protein
MGIGLWVSIAALLASCSTTPGDAAFRSGHFDVAARLYLSGASAGNDMAAYKLATMYDGTNWTRAELGRDEAKAITFYEKAFALGHLTVPAYVGAIYELGGQNVAINYELARQWYEKGAHIGQHTSMYSLGGLYARNFLKPADDITGLMWIEVARKMAAGFKPNKGTEYILSDHLGYWQTLRHRMDPVAIETATKRADDFIRSYQPPAKGELDPADWTQ